MYLPLINTLRGCWPVFFDERVTAGEMEAASGEEQSWKPEDEDEKLLGVFWLDTSRYSACLAWSASRRLSFGACTGSAATGWKVLHMSKAHKACAAGQHSCGPAG